MKRSVFLLCILVMSVMMFAACGSDDDGVVADGDTDSVTDGDQGEDGDDDGDAEQADGDQAEELCPDWVGAPDIEVDDTRRKFAVNLFHYNLQYVAGGLKGFGQGAHDDWFDYDEIETEDMIITRGFDPIVAIYEEHPQWHATFEMQGLMIDAIRERHSELHQRLRDLVEAGTIEIQSWHYSDQLFLAYPASNQEWSIRINDRAWQTACIPRGQGVFTQEGQFGEGMIPMMQRDDWALGAYDYGLYAINMFNTFCGEHLPSLPWYNWRDMTIFIAGRDVDDEASGISTRWTYFDDGELLATGYANPYLGDYFKVSESSIAKYVEEMEELEAEGYAHLTLREYKAHLEAINVDKPDIPAILDGSWQAHETGDFFRWMGDRGTTAAIEYDNGVLTKNYRTQNQINAAELALVYYEEDKGQQQEMRDKLDFAKRELLLAQVSDSTGWNPWKGEIEYSLNHAEEALIESASVIDGIIEGLGWEHIRVELKSGEVSKDMIMAEAPEPTDAPFELEIVAENRDVTTEWFKLGEKSKQVRITFGKTSVAEESGMTPVSVAFPFESDVISYSPALSEEEVVSYPRSQFPQVVEEGADKTTYARDFMHLPLANGLLKVGEDKWLIKNMFQIHLAPRIPMNTKAEGSDKVVYMDNTMRDTDSVTWLFYCYEGSQEEALAFANGVNTFATYQK